MDNPSSAETFGINRQILTGGKTLPHSQPEEIGSQNNTAVNTLVNTNASDNSFQSIDQLFVGAFPSWDLLPQTGFVRRIKRPNTF